MSRIAQYRAILNKQHTQPLAGTHAADPLLRSLLVHVAFADGQVDEREFERLRQIIPGRELGALLGWVDTESRTDMDLPGLLRAFPFPSDRRALLDLAELMAAANGRIDPGEARLLDTLKSIIQL
jgi:uncharacterized tellurite resistance protein B-like protein